MNIIKNNVLNAHHIEDLKKSGLTDETISQEEASQVLGFTTPSGGWIVSYPRSTFLKFKPDEPFTAKMKHLSSKDTAPELFITHLAAIGVSGVWNWKSKGHIIEGQVIPNKCNSFTF